MTVRAAADPCGQGEPAHQRRTHEICPTPFPSVPLPPSPRSSSELCLRFPPRGVQTQGLLPYMFRPPPGSAASTLSDHGSFADAKVCACWEECLLWGWECKCWASRVMFVCVCVCARTRVCVCPLC